MEEIYMQNLASFIEYTDKPYTHTFMRIWLDNGTIEEVEMFTDAKGKKYKTRLDDSIRIGGKGVTSKRRMRMELISAFETLLKASELHIA
jgi:hypothetical protein